MKFGIAAVMALLAATLPAASDAAEPKDPAQTIVVARSGSQPSAPGPAEYFTGARGIGPEQLAPASGPLLAINEADEKRRAAFVEQNVGPVSAGVVRYTSDPLFHDVWLRPALAPRDRSLVTISALIGTGQLAQLSAHLNRAMDNGITQSEGSEVLTHLLFYAGWPNVFTAAPIAKDVFEKRSTK